MRRVRPAPTSAALARDVFSPSPHSKAPSTGTPARSRQREQPRAQRLAIERLEAIEERQQQTGADLRDQHDRHDGEERRGRGSHHQVRRQLHRRVDGDRRAERQRAGRAPSALSVIARASVESGSDDRPYRRSSRKLR